MIAFKAAIDAVWPAQPWLAFFGALDPIMVRALPLPTLAAGAAVVATGSRRAE